MRKSTRRPSRSAVVLGGLVALLLAGSATAVSSPTGAAGPPLPRPKYVFLMIGDGMGDSEITIARNYTVGAGGKLALDRLPYTGQMTTFSVLETDPSTPDYTPESASTATAWSTGKKTADGRISTSPGTDLDLKTILEVAQARGIATGNVSTAEITDATPAAPMAHVVARACQGPANMTACPQDAKPAGPGSIAEQAVDHEVDVLLGGGRARFEQTILGGPDAGQTVIESAVDRGYQFIQTAAELGSIDPDEKVIGLFNAGNMSVDWTGLAAANPASGPQRCTEDQRPANEPSLSQMTETAIDVLRERGGSKGFLLQVESASIDKRDHVSQVCEQIGETVNFDQAVQTVMEFATRHPGSLVIIAGDHAHTSQIVEPDATPAGFSSILETDEGGSMQVTYGTGTSPTGQEHTGSQIRVAAYGRGAAQVIGLIDQTDLFAILKQGLG